MPPPESKPSAAKESDIVVVDLGTKKRKQVKLLRKGKGKLMEKVKQCIDELKASGTITGAATPVVIVVEEEAVPWDFLGTMRK
jgi:Family of unknown function (DUF6200)